MSDIYTAENAVIPLLDIRNQHQLSVTTAEMHSQ